MSLLSVSNTLHLLAAVIWVGGMFFAYMALRPAASGLDPAIKGPLWERTLGRFFPWVWVSILILLATGYWMLFKHFGGFAHAPLYVHIMHAVGIGMILLFLHVFFAPYRRLGQTNAKNDFSASVKHLAQIRRMVAINLGLGITVVLVVGAGRFWIG